MATPTQLLLIDEGPAGAGWWTAPPPYENLTQVWASSTGLSWRQENIPSAMRLSALGPAVYGHDDVVAVASDVITHEQGVWVFRQGRWAFHQTTGTDHAGVFAWSMTATPSGFLAGGQVTTGTTQEPAVWTSGDGVHWRETVLSRAGGSVNAVLDRDGTLVAAGSSGPGGTAGYWRASGRTWIADPVSGDPPVPQSLALIGGHVLALSRNGVVSAYSPQGWVAVPGLGEPPSDDVLSVGSSAVLSGRLVGFMEPPLEKGMAVAPPLQPWSFTVRNT